MLTVLVTARGTGAVRVLDAALDSGLRAVTVYEPGALRTLPPDLADEAYALSRRVGSEWPIEEILRAVRVTGADIVHPGFTSPSRDAALARAVEGAGLLWGGAPPALLDELARTAAVDPADPGGRAVDDDIERIGARRLHALPAPPRRLSAVVARQSGGPVQVLCVSEWSAQSATTDDAAIPRASIVDCPATGPGVGVAAAIDSFSQRLPGMGFTHGLVTLDLDVTPGGAVRLAAVRAGVQPDHAAAEEAFDVDFAALELELAIGAPKPSWPGNPVRHARCRIVRPRHRTIGRAPNRVVELALPGGTGVRCDAGVRVGDLVPDPSDVLFVVTASGADTRQAAMRAERAFNRLVVVGVPIAVDEAWPVAATTVGPVDVHEGVSAEPPDLTASLFRSGASQAVVDAALAEVAPGVRTLLLEVDHRRVRIAVHPHTRPPHKHPPRPLHADLAAAGDMAHL